MTDWAAILRASRLDEEALRVQIEAAPFNDDEFATIIRDIDRSNMNEDPAHHLADELLCLILKRLGWEKTVEAFDALPKWYS